MRPHVNVLVISGSMGSGKTTVSAEVSDLLTLAGILHGAVDLDCLGLGHLPAVMQEQFVARVAELEASLLDTGCVEDFSVENESQSVTEVSREVLVRASWL